MLKELKGKKSVSLCKYLWIYYLPQWCLFVCSSASRLKKIQSVLTATNTDGLLCIQGIMRVHASGVQISTNPASEEMFV